MRESFLKRLLSTIRCSICGRHYEAGNVNVLGQQGKLWFISLFCPTCGSHCLVAAVVKEDTQVITDITEKEQAKFRHSEAIGIDDVLDIHNFLREFNGDISKLFSQK